MSRDGGKKYQVFLSSTFLDLKEERNLCVTAIMRLGSFPVGMELFPASDNSQWDIIKRRISECDYYILLTGGRYGSMIGSISYTESEYNLACELGIPVIPFLMNGHAEVFHERADETGDNLSKLNKFRQKLSTQHTCQYWTEKADLAAAVYPSILDSIDNIPRTGWIRADQAPSSENINELIKIQSEYSSLQKELEKLRAEQRVIHDAERLSSGEEQIDVKGVVQQSYSGSKQQWSRSVSWNLILKVLAPHVQSLTNLAAITTGLKNLYYADEPTQVIKMPIHKPYNLSIESESVQIILAQLEILGFIQSGIYNTNNGGSGQFWKITDVGNATYKNMIIVERAK